MNTYSMEEMLAVLVRHGCASFHGEFLLEQRFWGGMLYFRRPVLTAAA